MCDASLVLFRSEERNVAKHEKDMLEEVRVEEIIGSTCNVQLQSK